MVRPHRRPRRGGPRVPRQRPPLVHPGPRRLGEGGGDLIRKLLGPLLGALLSTIAAALGATAGVAGGLPAVATVSLVVAGSLLGGLFGLLVALVMPPAPSAADHALGALARGDPLPDGAAALAPARALRRRLEDHAREEDQLRQQLADLRRRAVATAAQARADAQSASHATEVRSAFLTRMSHELRTPLNAVIGYAEMVSEEVDDPELQQDLTRIRRAGLHLKGLVTTVLDLTQLESGRYEVRPEPVDLVPMIQEVVEGAANEADAQQDTVELDLPPRAMATVDPRMVQSILFNLIHNAVKYTARGTVRVRLTLDDRLVFTVSDTGIGMTRRQIEQAFQPFVQGDSGTTRRYDGAGLGLAICRGFAEAMGGGIAIDAKLGQGATVTVTLPLVVEAHLPDDEDSDEPTLFLR